MAIGLSYKFFSGIFVIVAILTALSWWKQAQSVVKVAFVLILVGGALIEPWKFIVLPSSESPYAYDWTYLRNMRAISLVWLLLSIFTASRMAQVIRRKKVKKDAANAA